MLYALIFEHVVELVYESRLNHLGLLCGCRSADSGRRAAIAVGCVAI
jgi:hypothetical protein